MLASPPGRPAPRPRIVLAGGGHAHLYTLRRTAELTRRGFDVTLIDPSPYLYYSGMATGVVSGVYTPEEDRIDVRRLVEGGGGSFVQGRVRTVHGEDRALVLEDGRAVPYDAVSFCLGSTTPTNKVPDDGRVLPVKPVENAAEIKRRLLLDGDRPVKLLVVGGGAAGCEVAANALALLDRRPAGGEVAVVERGDWLLEGSPKPARRSIRAYLEGRGARVLTGTEVVSYDAGRARTSRGDLLPYDLAVLAVGIVASGRVFRASGLPVGPCGGLWVDRALRSVADGRIFGGGDAVSYRGLGLPKLGVFAVRQGPVLYHNLQAVPRGEPVRRYNPQKRFLYVLNLGDGTGLAVYDRVAWRGRLAWKLKSYVDRRFMAEYGGSA
ncbi:NAD(P)/FAD-dependent oxidoreductase [Rubrobacter marinus]|uniref:NAD(P)/FAD-dependent oxidoreductase n=1 Tax=Rubrobacter marinus TaxID=2653852 RepID=UPI00140C92A8|nr:FAD-dependent oxidoreductase [Rubrobacter marinus]